MQVFHLANKKDASFVCRNTSAPAFSEILCLSPCDSLGGNKFVENKGLDFHLQGLKGSSKSSKT